MDRTRVPVPKFGASYESYMANVEVWKLLCGLPKTEQGIMLWYNLPDDHSSDIKAKIFNEVGVEKLKSEGGLDTFVAAMDEAFKPEAEVKAYEVFVDFFVDLKRKPDEKIKDFIVRFDKLANVAKKHNMSLSETVLGLKLLHDAGLSPTDKKLVMSEVNFQKPEGVYKEAKLGLAKYLTDSSGLAEATGGIKLEQGLISREVEEALVSKGWVRPAGRGGRGGGGNNGKRGGGKARGGKSQVEKPINPTGDDGEPLKCVSCGSFRHMLSSCPDSYENLRKSKAFTAQEEEEKEDDSEEAFFTSNFEAGQRRVAKEGDVEDIVLYSGKREDVSGLCSETLGCALLDCGCTSNVCGELWLKSYLASLSEEEKGKVVEEESKGKRFRFGGGEVLASLKQVTFPAVLAGKGVMIKSHVVRSKIPLLWSKPSMARAGVLLDLPGDRARILGIWVDLEVTSAGHYALFILPVEEKLTKVESCLLALPKEDKEKEGVLLKLHRQFGHPREEVMETLLKEVKVWNATVKEIVGKIHSRCKTCKMFSPTPPRPVVSLPAASDFNEVLTLDLKEVKVQSYKYIFHMIDGFTRLTVSVFLRNKKPETIVHHLMLNWVSVGYGRPKRMWTDNGGEFNNDTVRQLAEALGCKVETGAGYAAWMNGLNERNHSVVDRCFAKIIKENPKMDPVVALAWAVSAKNAFPMYGGYSSYQLVFGKDPHLPNILTDKLPALSGVTTSESVAAHIQGLYSGRKAFMEAVCDDRIRKALRHKVRAVERRFMQGEQVYYRREGDKAQWRGPATVLGNKGAVHYLVHQGDVVRVAACRLVSTAEAEEQMSGKQGAAEASKQEEAEQLSTDKGIELGRLEQKQEEQGTPQERQQEEEQEVHQHGEQALAPVEANDQVAREPRQQRQQAQRSVTAPADGRMRATGRKQTMYPKAGDHIQYKEGEDWHSAEVMGRGGKASSKLHYDYFNLRREDEQQSGVHLDKTEWRFDNAAKNQLGGVQEEEEEVEEANIALIPAKDHSRQECVEAKQKELKAFEDFEVYTEVEDKGQERLSSRWILTDKSTPQEVKVKARLVCRGFEETVEVQADSPTGSKETLHMLLCIAATKGWKIKSGDVKNAYLQGEKLDREVFMEPPIEKRKPNTIWKLQKSVYGMNDAGRRWFFKVEETLVTLGCKQSSLDHCLFFYRSKGELKGIILVWVDDIFYAGQNEFEEKVIAEVGRQFLIGRTEEETFTYIGLSIQTVAEGITLDQTKYISSRLAPADLKAGLNSRPLDKEEKKLLRRLTGQINWAATQSRPDLSYSVVELSTRFSQPTLEDLKKANKAITRLAATPIKVLFPRLTGRIRVEVYSDAAFRNLPDQISSGRGHIVFLANEKNRAAPLGWNSNKVKRVVGSTIAAEGLSLQMAIAHAFFLRAVLAEITDVDMFKIPIRAYVDSRNLYEAVFSTKFVEDKKLRCDIAQIQESVQKEKVDLRWTQAGSMLADCLTKKGANPDPLLEVLRTGKLPTLDN